MADKRACLIALSTLSFAGRVFTANERLYTDFKTAEYLESHGLAKLEEGISEVDHLPESDEDIFDNMSVAELKEYATEAGIDISKVSKKADIISTIKKAEKNDIV